MFGLMEPIFMDMTALIHGYLTPAPTHGRIKLGKVWTQSRAVYIPGQMATTFTIPKVRPNVFLIKRLPRGQPRPGAD
jgi:hypothetical protein